MNEPKPPFVHKEANDSPGFLLWQVTTLWQRQISAALRPFGLTQVQFVLLIGLLWLTTDDSLITQIMLATHTKLDTMMTSQVLRALETRGLVGRKPHPQDSRAKVLHLTAEGRALALRALPAVDGTDAEFFARIAGAQPGFNAALEALLAREQTAPGTR
jgi:DNA-binding MarR family transcriptional regulator